jgi:LPXTG-motif cell wall-anchored protein
MSMVRVLRGKGRLRAFAAAAALTSTLLAPAAASADTYTGTPPPQVGAVDSAVRPKAKVQSASTASASDPASLPVTGSDLASLAALGFGALGVGTVLVLKTRSRKVDPG